MCGKYCKDFLHNNNMLEAFMLNNLNFQNKSGFNLDGSCTT